MEQLGLKTGDTKPISPESQTTLRRAIQGLAWDVWSLHESQKKIENTIVGYRAKKMKSLSIISILMGGENETVYFDPKHAPEEPELLEVWQELKSQWDQAEHGIGKAASTYPEIYEAVAENMYDKLLELSRVVPEHFGEQQKVLLQGLADRIKHVEDMVISKELDVLAFQQLEKRMAAVGLWSSGFNAYFAGLIVDEHAKNTSMAAKISELGTGAIVLLAPFSSTGIGAALEAAAVGVTLGAAYVEEQETSRQAEASRATPLTGAELVDRAVADEADAKATEQLVVAGVLAVISVITAGAAGGVKLVDAMRMARLRTLITDEALLTKLLIKVPDKARLYKVASLAGDVTKLDGLLTTVADVGQLEGLLTRAGSAAQLESLLGKIPDLARLTKLLDAAGDGERLSVMLTRLGGVDAVETELAGQAAGEAATLRGADAMKRVTKAFDAMKDGWEGLSAEQRLNRAAAEVNGELQVQGVPPIRVVASEVPSQLGGFRSYDWSVEVDPGLLNGDPAGLGKTLMHEARHAEQDFLAARLSGTRGMDVDTMTFPRSDGGLALPRNVAEAARARPLPLDSTQGAFAKEMADASVKFKGKVYARIVDRLYDATVLRDDAKFDLTVAENRPGAKWNSPEVVAAKARVREGEAAFDIADKAYRNIPFEKDAFAVETEFERHMAAAAAK